MNNKLQQAEDKLKSIVETNSPKTTTVYVEDSNGKLISKPQYINKNTIYIKTFVDKYEEIKSGSILYMSEIFPLLATPAAEAIPHKLDGIKARSGKIIPINNP